MRKRLLIIGVIICLLVSGCSLPSSSRYDDDDTYESESSGKKKKKSKADTEISLPGKGSTDSSENGDSGNGGNSHTDTGSIIVNCDGETVEGTPVRTRYYRSQLSAEEQKVYDEIYVIVSRMLGETDISTVDTDVVSKASNAIMYDFPEFFYFSSYTYMQYTLNGDIQKITFIGDYSMSEAERDSYQGMVDDYVIQFKNTLYSGMSDYEVAKALYEYIAWGTEYVLNSPEDQNILSVACYHKSVCSGYARTYQYIMNSLGYDTVYVYGNSLKTGESHAWLKVKLDGEYYNIDATWGDVSIPGFDTSFVNPASVCYDYFCVPDSWNDISHRTEYFLPVPACTATADNFYVHSGLYLDSSDSNAFMNIVNICENQNFGVVAFKCSDAQVFAYWKDYLFTQSHVFDFINAGSEGISYSCDDYSYVIIIG